MKIRAIINEAEQNLAKKKIDQHLSQLSNKDLVSLLPLLKESLIEGSEDMAQQKQEGKRIYGGSANFIAYDDESKTAQRFKDTPKGLEVTAVQYKPDNDPRRGATFNAPSDAEIKSAMKQDSVSRTPAPTPEPEIKQIVQNSEKSEVEALADAVAKELEMRKVGQKQSPNTKSNPALLKKVLTALLAGGLLAGAYGLGTMSAGVKSDSPELTAFSPIRTQNGQVVDKFSFNPEKTVAPQVEPEVEPKPDKPFTVKGIQFGMDSATVKKLMGDNFTILGIDNWEAEYEDDKLVRLRIKDAYKRHKAGTFYYAILQKFGKPDTGKKLDDMGYATWNIDDAVISTKRSIKHEFTNKYSSSDLNWAWIESKSHSENRNAEGNKERDSAATDFEESTELDNIKLLAGLN